MQRCLLAKEVQQKDVPPKHRPVGHRPGTLSHPEMVLARQY